MKILVLTRGGPWMWPHDNYDHDVLSSAVRRNDASRGVGRTHSSRKTRRRRPCTSRIVTQAALGIWKSPLQCESQE